LAYPARLIMALFLTDDQGRRIREELLVLGVLTSAVANRSHHRHGGHGHGSGGRASAHSVHGQD